jgi:hypothetical protein
MNALARSIQRFFLPNTLKGGHPAPRERVDTVARYLQGFAFRYLDRARLADALAQLLRSADEVVERHHAHEANRPGDLWLADGIVVVINEDTTACQARLRLRHMSLHPQIRGVVAITTAAWAGEFAGERFYETGTPIAIVRVTRWIEQ